MQLSKDTLLDINYSFAFTLYHSFKVLYAFQCVIIIILLLYV